MAFKGGGMRTLVRAQSNPRIAGKTQITNAEEHLC